MLRVALASVNRGKSHFDRFILRIANGRLHTSIPVNRPGTLLSDVRDNLVPWHMGKSKPASRPKKQSKAKTIAPTQYWFGWSYLWLSLVIIFFAAIRFRLRAMPLERDEGEYAYGGQLLLQGVPPYKLLYTMKLPGTHAAYAMIMAVFGQTPQGIRIGLLLLNAATTVLLYLLAKRLFGGIAAVITGACYALLSTSFSVLGLSAHATHFVVFFAVAGLLVLLQAIEAQRTWQFFAAGLLLGLAFLMKQPGIVFALFGGLYLLYSEWRRPGERSRSLWIQLGVRAGAYAAGAILPFAATCLVLYVCGVFPRFWFWVFTYAAAYTSENSFSDGVHIFADAFPKIMGPSFGLWILAAIGLGCLIWGKDKDIRRHAFLIGGWLFFSFLGVCPGLYFRAHYFILMLPVVAVLAGVGVHATTQFLAQGKGATWRAVPIVVFLVLFGYSVIEHRTFFFDLDPVQACQREFGTNPFPEAVEVAKYLDAHSNPGDQIGVLGSEPEIYFYAKRHSVTGFVYMYELVEQQKYAAEMRAQMMHEIESAHPQFLVSVSCRASWLPRSSPQALGSILDWAGKYFEQYELVGVTDRVGNQIEYRWDADAKTYKPRSSNIVAVFRRKN
jgi:hypothetical protein